MIPIVHQSKISVTKMPVTYLAQPDLEIPNISATASPIDESVYAPIKIVSTILYCYCSSKDIYCLAYLVNLMNRKIKQTDATINNEHSITTSTPLLLSRDYCASGELLKESVVSTIRTSMKMKSTHITRMNPRCSNFSFLLNLASSSGSMFVLCSCKISLIRWKHWLKANMIEQY